MSLVNWVKNRVTEKTTSAGVGTLLTLIIQTFNLQVSDTLYQAIIVLINAVIGVALVFWNERKNPQAESVVRRGK